MMIIKALVFFICLLTMSVACMGQCPSSNRRPDDIRLILQLRKNHYRTGEPIRPTAFLQNISKRRYYVGRSFPSFLGTSGLHDVVLRVFNRYGKEIKLGRIAGDWIWKLDTPLRAKLEEYVLLDPGNLHGSSDTLPLSLAPGMYWLQTNYSEEEAQSWTNQEMNEIDAPIWLGPLNSNCVAISVNR
jgi:hypothetical protein